MDIYFHAYTRVIIALCVDVVSMERKFIPCEAAAADMNTDRRERKLSPCGIIITLTPLLRLTWKPNPDERFLLTANKKKHTYLSDWLLLRMKVFSLYTTAFNVSPSVRLQEFDDNWSIPVRSCHRVKSHIHVVLHMARKSELLLLLWR